MMIENHGLASKIRLKYVPVVLIIALIIALAGWYFLDFTLIRTLGAGIFILLLLGYIVLRVDPEAPVEQKLEGCCGGHDVTAYYYGEDDKK